MILIFDTYGGLCNQFYDIITGINFCLKHQIKDSTFKVPLRTIRGHSQNTTGWRTLQLSSL